MTAPYHSCGNKAKHVKMLTFDYWYCETCKEEVGGKAEKKPVVLPPPEYSDPNVVYDSAGMARARSGIALLYGSAATKVAINPGPATTGQAANAGNGNTPPATNPAGTCALRPLPPGIVALKGEDLCCERCWQTVGVIDDDIPEFLHNWASKISPTRSAVCCSGQRYRRWTGALYQYFVRGRGWV